jgi:hypothetical protein
MKTLPLSPKPPRDLSLFQDSIPFKEGLGSYFFFGFFFLGFLIFMLLAVFFFFKNTSPGLRAFQVIGGLILFGGLGFLSLRHAYQVRGERQMAVQHGIPVNGKIVAKGKQFNPFRSGRDHNVGIRFEYEGQTLARNFVLYVAQPQNYALGQELKGLYDPASGAAFFPGVLGLEIDWQEP